MIHENVRSLSLIQSNTNSMVNLIILKFKFHFSNEVRFKTYDQSHAVTYQSAKSIPCIKLTIVCRDHYDPLVVTEIRKAISSKLKEKPKHGSHIKCFYNKK